ncbi:MAG TPA: hypothetical protein VIV60_28850, partial [Polyangiaceae bacterium]
AGGAVVFTGSIEWSANFGGADITHEGRGGFLAKLDANGNHVFSQALPTTSNGGVASDATGALWVSANYTGAIELAGATFDANTSKSLLLIKFDTNGVPTWAASGQSPEARPGSVVTDPNGNAYCTGDFWDMLQIGTASAITPGTGAYLVKFAP